MPKKKKTKDTAIHLEKAYKNLNFLTSPSARHIRVLSEFIEPEYRFRNQSIKDTVVFFGSARTLPPKEARERLKKASSSLKGKKKTDKKLLREFELAKRGVEHSRYYADAAKLSEKLTKWAMNLPGKYRRFAVCSGGGPGIMEAANLGAKRAGGRSIGLNISLPMEQAPNIHQTQNISMIFHYFFIRKFWFVYLAKALVVFPGGFGTMDELFEILTLVQTEKTKKDLPILIYGPKFWKELINFDLLLEWDVIDKKDLKLFSFFDDVDEAFEFLKKELTKRYLRR